MNENHDFSIWVKRQVKVLSLIATNYQILNCEFLKNILLLMNQFSPTLSWISPSQMLKTHPKQALKVNLKYFSALNLIPNLQIQIDWCSFSKWLLFRLTFLLISLSPYLSTPFTWFLKKDLRDSLCNANQFNMAFDQSLQNLNYSLFLLVQIFIQSQKYEKDYLSFNNYQDRLFLLILYTFLEFQSLISLKIESCFNHFLCFQLSNSVTL